MQHKYCTLHFLGLVFPAVMVGAVTVEIGQSATISCKLNCSKVEWWTKSETDLCILQFAEGKCTVAPEYMGRIECSEENIKGGDVSINITSVVYNDQGWYYCSCDGKEQCDRKIEVLVPTALNISFGGKATLPCFAQTNKRTADSNVYVLWQKDEQKVLKLENGEMVFGPEFAQRATVSTEAYKKGDLSLTITETRYSDSGLYRCFLKDGGYGYPNSVTLAVKAHQFKHYKQEGDSVEMDVAIPQLVMVYFKADKNTTETLMCTRAKDAVHCMPGYDQRASFLKNSLTLKELTVEDSGTYRVKDKESEVIVIHKLNVVASTSGMVLLMTLGCVFGVVIIAAIPAAVLWCFCKKHRQQPESKKETDETGTEDEHVHFSIQQSESSIRSPIPMYEMEKFCEIIDSSPSQPDQDAQS